jgi:hypothetical protein
MHHRGTPRRHAAAGTTRLVGTTRLDGVDSVDRVVGFGGIDRARVAVATVLFPAVLFPAVVFPTVLFPAVLFPIVLTSAAVVFFVLDVVVPVVARGRTAFVSRVFAVAGSIVVSLAATVDAGIIDDVVLHGGVDVR